MKKIVTNSPEDTFALGKKLGSLLKPGSILCLTGEMGAGKTAITKGIAEGVGIKDYITSPTYTIVNEYQGNIPVYHFDVFRLEDPGELEEIGFDEYLFGEGIVIIEWASIIREVLPTEHLWITIEKNENMDERVLSFEAQGQYYEDLIKEL